MPTSYTTTVTVDGFAGANYGSQLDSLEIISGSTNPYELPQPPSARASFLGLPVVSGVTQTPDWWIGKKVTFTIAPQGATGTVTWVGIVQGYTCRPVQTTSTDQIVELDLLGPTAYLSGQYVTGRGGTFKSWSYFITRINGFLQSQTWQELPDDLSWSEVEGTWDTVNFNPANLSVVYDTTGTGAFCSDTETSIQDALSLITDIWSKKYHGWFWFDDTIMTVNSPDSYTNYSSITSLNATTCVLWSSLNVNQNLNNVINQGTVQDMDGNSFVYLDGASFFDYGLRPQDFGTTYEVSTGLLFPGKAQAMLDDKIKAYKQPNKYLQSLTINLDAMTHVTGEWQNFYKSTKPVRLPLTNIPAAYGGNHTYMVRGVQLNLTRRHAEATLLVVPETIYNPS